jgi:hypothetical protein
VGHDPLEVEEAEFLRLHRLRGPQIMWLLGAGASAAARMPTAQDLIWRFKRELYCSRERVPLAALEDLHSPAVQSLLHGYFDSLGGFPSAGAEDEYAAFFEATYPSEADRRHYLEPFIRGASPSFGHKVFAALMVIGRVTLIWTPNFDRCLEDAAAMMFGSTTGLTVADLDAPEVARQGVIEGRWPVLVKLHGDFRSRRLKNTSEELRRQDANLRATLVDTCHTHGLAVVGYSGRDASIMDALEDALNRSNPFPGGLFWFTRPGDEPLPRVQRLLDRAATAGVEAHFVVVPTFDELAGDLLVLGPDLPPDVVARLEDPRAARRRCPSPPVRLGGDYPVVRLNALPLGTPSSSRLIACNIGGIAEVRTAVEEAGADVIVARRHQGVLAFGDDKVLRRTFDAFAITEFGLFDLEDRRFGYDSAELGLCYDALMRALVRERPLLPAHPGRTRTLIVHRDTADDPLFDPLQKATCTITGTIPGTELPWAEGVVLRIERRMGRTWLCYEPIVWAAKTEDTALASLRSEFLRNRLVRRYNRQANDLLGAWQHVLTGGPPEASLRAFGEINGVDASFCIAGRGAHSWKERR